MTRNVLLPLLLLFSLSTCVLAQTGIEPRVLPVRVQDALRFGTTDPLGSARFLATGGSMTSIGVDATTLHTNPAGIGWNRFSVAQISPGFGLLSTDNQLRNGGGNPSVMSTKGNFMIPSASYLFASETNSIDWNTLNFGVSFTRLANLNGTVEYNGRSEGSIIDGVVENLNDGFPDPFRDVLAQRIPNVIQEDEQGFFSDFDLDTSLGGQIRREGRIERTGAIDEIAVGFGGNYRETVLWGLSIGIPSINFTETRTYNEVDDRDEITFFDDAAFNENLELSGTGFNLKFGLIGRIGEQLRLSAAVHSPTFWTVDEEFSTDFTYNFTDQGVAQGGTERSDLSVTVFNIRTPWRFAAGAGYLIGRKGFVSVDADYSDFRGTSFASDDFASVDDAANADVDNTLASSVGVKLGGEVNLRPFQLRAGVGYRTFPVADLRNDEDAANLNLSLGAGYATGKFFVDLGVRADSRATFESPYSTFRIDGQVVDTDRSRLTGVLTVGLRGF